MGLSNSSIEATGKCTDFDLDWEIPFIVTVTDSSFVCELGSSITQYQGEQVWARNIFVGDVYVNARGDFSDPVEIFQFEENTVNGVFHLVAQVCNQLWSHRTIFLTPRFIRTLKL